MLDSSDVLTEKQQIKIGNGAVNSLAYSPDGKWLCTGDSAKVVQLYDVGANYEVGVDSIGGGGVLGG